MLCYATLQNIAVRKLVSGVYWDILAGRALYLAKFLSTASCNCSFAYFTLF